MGFVGNGAVQVAPASLGVADTAAEPGPPGPPLFLPLIEKEYTRLLVKPVADAGEVASTVVKHKGIAEQFCGATPLPFA
jgi:hypothetical protein